MQAKTKLSTEVENLVTTIVEAALALASKVPRDELEQRFEFAWGHQNVTSRMPAAVCLSMRLVRT